MKTRKRIQKPQKIQLPLYSADGSEINMQSYYDYYDEQYMHDSLLEEEEEEECGGLSYEELEEVGAIIIRKATKCIDGETAAFSAIKNGEDW